MRLQKALAEAGLGSRRRCEEIILAGRVRVNGAPVLELGTTVLDSDVIKVDGNAITRQKKRYFAFYKPVNVLSAMGKKEGVRTVESFFEDIKERVFYAGRLDYQSRGLMIVTNDGDFAQRVAHPSKHTQKTYRVTVEGTLNGEALLRASKGITVKGARYAPFKFQILRKNNRYALIKITINEGKNREIRNIFEYVGNPVVDLERIAIGAVTAYDSGRGDIREGERRELTEEEIASFGKGELPNAKTAAPHLQVKRKRAKPAKKKSPRRDVLNRSTEKSSKRNRSTR